MADCKTMMVRRNSREHSIGTTCASGARGGGGGAGGSSSTTHHHHHPSLPPPLHHQQHHSRTNSTTSRSKSYHHHYSLHYHNQCQYYNTPFNCGTAFQTPGYGFESPPQMEPQHHPHQHHQPQQQPNENGYAGNNHNGPHTPRYQQEPPPRPWIQLAHHKHKRTCFTVLCYNILCSHYATHAMYSYCPSWALDWNYRRKAILQELVHYAADIISLQEMETDQYYNFFLPQLQLLGYSGIFAAKSRARTMVESKRKLVDGCAIFYKTNKFRLLSEHLIEFSQVAISNATRCAQCSEEMLNRVQTKDNIALAALLETKTDSEVKGLRGLVTPRPRPLLVCTCHIHWDPNYCDVKLVQTMMLMQELKKITENLDVEDTTSGGGPVVATCPCTGRPNNNNGKAHNHNTRSGSSSSTGSSASYSYSKQQNPLENVNLLICGDFNSLPQSGVVEFMQCGSISSSHPDFKGLSYEGYIENTSRTEEEPETTGSNNKDCGDIGHKKHNSNSKAAAVNSKSSSSGRGGGVVKSSEEFQHNFNLKSVYSPCTMPFTNYTLEFQGVIDYIFHSVKGLRPLGLLGPLDPTWLVQHNVVGAPHPCIPSDHLPLVVEFEMLPAI